jgi:hypothetical protein
MQLSTREAAKIFRKLEIRPAKSSHHVRGFLVVDGVKVLPLHYSHGHKDLPGNVPRRFAKSLKLTPAEFAELKRCTMSRDNYLELLIERGIVTRAPSARTY